jgi:hypothetical protein
VFFESRVPAANGARGIRNERRGGPTWKIRLRVPGRPRHSFQFLRSISVFFESRVPAAISSESYRGFAYRERLAKRPPPVGNETVRRIGDVRDGSSR